MSLESPPASPGLSVVIPVFNEEESIGSLLDEIAIVLDGIGLSSEIVVVNDGSSDGTARVLGEWAGRHSSLRIVDRTANSGQGAALLCGLRAARGEVIVTLDGDGQNVPGDIPKLLEQLGGSDLVVGIRVGRRDSPLRRWMSKVANGVRSRILQDGVSDAGCALKAMRREVVEALIPIQTLYSFVPALVAGGGFRVTEIAVNHRKRQGGVSNYGLGKMLWRPLVDMLGVAWFNRRRCWPRAAVSGKPWLLAAVSIVTAYFLFLGRHGLLEPDEGRYAEVAREMAGSGGLLTPTLNGFVHVEKPPVIYWLTALSYRLFGPSEFSSRLPSALASLGIIFLTYQIGKDLAGRRAGWLSALVLASSFQFFFMARLLTADMVLSFSITAAVACLVKHYVQPCGKVYGWLFFVFMGLGFLTKGPMALVVPLSAAAGLSWRRDGELPLRLPWLVGIPLTLAIALSWFIAIGAVHPGLYDYFFNAELKDRFLSANHGRSQPFWFFLPVLLIGFLPWSLFLVPDQIRRVARRKGLTRGARFLLVWVTVPLLVLSASGSKLVTYVLPVLPALAVAVALAIADRSPPGRVLLRILGFSAIALGMGLLAWRFAAPERLVFAAALPSVIAIVLAGLSLVHFGRTGRTPGNTVPRIALASLVVWLAVASQAGKVNDLLGRQASMRPIAGILNELPSPENLRIIACNIRAHGLEFYLGRTVDVTKGQADLVVAPARAQRSHVHRSAASVSQIGPDPDRRTFVVTRTPDWIRDFEPSGRWTPVAKSGDFNLLELTSRSPLNGQ